MKLKIFGIFTVLATLLAAGGGRWSW